MPDFKVLIANRGEIALRIVRACKDLGIPCVAVYSTADRNALHVRYADEAYELGPAPAAESYLNVPKLLEIARMSGATALHPGYGFLSENASFAQACEDAGLIFIGPKPETIHLLGDKVEARIAMQQAGVPVAPGSETLPSIAEASAMADNIGYPVLIKAAGGGGGRGMRVVQEPFELEDALAMAASEAQQAFGNGAIYLEKYLSPVRHIEMQIMADGNGTIAVLGERECSIQRRHQKLIEEAPSTVVDPALRERLTEAARSTALATNYRGAGTVEFLLDQEGNFYFLEVNTRLQVEHPVTELVTGTDLVRDQLKVAMGEPLSYENGHNLPFHGWAIECRITAEDPYNDFLPTAGVIRALHEPSGPGIRVDSSLYLGQEITTYYDSLLAKLIAWGPDRETAIIRMERALREYTIVGVKTSIPFHLFALGSEDFRAGRLNTDFIAEKADELETSGEALALLATLAAGVMAQEEELINPSKPATQGSPISSWIAASHGLPISPWVSATRPIKDAGPSWQRPSTRS